VNQRTTAGTQSHHHEEIPMKTCPPVLAAVVTAALGFAATPARALNPQPEVPSKPAQTQLNPKALNPQPEVPSKNKKKSPERDQKKKSQPKMK
jgi:hypothetical protein